MGHWFAKKRPRKEEKRQTNDGNKTSTGESSDFSSSLNLYVHGTSFSTLINPIVSRVLWNFLNERPCFHARTRGPSWHSSRTGRICGKVETKNIACARTIATFSISRGSVFGTRRLQLGNGRVKCDREGSASNDTIKRKFYCNREPEGTQHRTGPVLRSCCSRKIFWANRQGFEGNLRDEYSNRDCSRKRWLVNGSAVTELLLIFSSLVDAFVAKRNFNQRINELNLAVYWSFKFSTLF